MVLFDGLRTMGHVTSSDVKFKLSSLGVENFVLTAVDRSWQIFKTERLSVAFTGVRFSFLSLSLSLKKKN